MAGWEGGVVSVSQSPHAPISPRHRSSRVRQSKRRRGRKEHSPLARSLSFVVHFVVHSFVPFQSFITGFGSQLHSKSLISINSLSFVICHLSFVIHRVSVQSVRSLLYSLLAFWHFAVSTESSTHRTRTAEYKLSFEVLYRQNSHFIHSVHQFISSSVRRPYAMICASHCMYVRLRFLELCWGLSGGYEMFFLRFACCTQTTVWQFGSFAVLRSACCLVVVWQGRVAEGEEALGCHFRRQHSLGGTERQTDRQTEKKGMMTIGKVGLGIGNWELVQLTQVEWFDLVVL